MSHRKDDGSRRVESLLRSLDVGGDEGISNGGRHDEVDGAAEDALGVLLDVSTCFGTD
jgi:hypothetical protein